MQKESNSTRPAPWTRVSEKTVYRGRIHVVEHSIKLPNGDDSTYDVDHSSGFAVATLIKTNDDNIVLSYQYRFPLDRWIYDLPGGGAQKGETPEEAATRECQEEVGLAPKHLAKLATFYPNPARTDWCANVFYCDTFDEAKIHLEDPSEHVERVLVPIAKLHELVESGEVVDPSLLIGWYAACAKGYITL